MSMTVSHKLSAQLLPLAHALVLPSVNYSKTMASRVQDDCHSAGHYAGAQMMDKHAGGRDSSSDSDSDSYSDYSSSDSEVEEEVIAYRRSKRSGEKADVAKAPVVSKKVGTHYQRRPRYPKYPADAVVDGTADAIDRSAAAAVDALTLRPVSFANSVAGTGSAALQAASLGAYDDRHSYAKAGAKSNVSVRSAPPKATDAKVEVGKNSGGGETCYFGHTCRGCTHQHCPRRQLSGAAEGAKPAGGSAPKGEWVTIVKTPRHVHCKKPRSGARSAGGSFKLEGAHAAGRCVTCKTPVARAGASCNCGRLQSVAV